MVYMDRGPCFRNTSVNVSRPESYREGCFSRLMIGSVASFTISWRFASSQAIACLGSAMADSDEKVVEDSNPLIANPFCVLINL